MFKLQDGREHLYQWDLDRYIIVEDPNICEVHFCNRTSDCSLVVEVKDGLAAIPNIILQDARPIRVYAYVDDKYTLTEQQFAVKSRTRPADYVYTETEVKRWEELAERTEAAIEKAETAANDATAAVDNANKTIEELQTQIADLATEDYVREQIAAIPEVDFTGYATENYVNDVIANHKAEDFFYFRLGNDLQGTGGEAPIEVAQFASTITRADYDAGNVKRTVFIEYDYMATSHNVQVEYGDPNWISITSGSFDADGSLKSFAVFSYPRDLESSKTNIINDRQIYLSFTKDSKSSTGWSYTSSLTTTKIPNEQYVKDAITNAVGVIENGTY